MLHEDQSKDVIGAAMTVLNTLRPGLDEKLYERALVIELRKRGHQIEQQKAYAVSYEGESIGTLIPDLIVDGAIVVDTKVVTAFNENHVSQMLGLSRHHATAGGALVELQKRAPRMEARRAIAGSATAHLSVPSVLSVVKCLGKSGASRR